MLADGGIEQNHTNRWLLDSATWVPWEIYICLLYAEIENYMAISKKYASLVYKPMDDYVASHNAMVRSLKDVRDALLHPLKRASYTRSLQAFVDRASRIASSYTMAIVEAQHFIDDYLHWFRDALIESVIEEAVAISDEQLLECKNVEGLTGLLDKSVDNEEKTAIKQSLKREFEFRDFLVQNFNPGSDLTVKAVPAARRVGGKEEHSQSASPEAALLFKPRLHSNAHNIGSCHLSYLTPK